MDEELTEPKFFLRHAHVGTELYCAVCGEEMTVGYYWNEVDADGSFIDKGIVRHYLCGKTE